MTQTTTVAVDAALRGRRNANQGSDKLPISPLLDDSVKDGVPSVQVGVLPSTDAGGVQVRFFVVPLANPLVELEDSTLNDDL